MATFISKSVLSGEFFQIVRGILPIRHPSREFIRLSTLFRISGNVLYHFLKIEYQKIQTYASSYRLIDKNASSLKLICQNLYTQRCRNRQRVPQQLPVLHHNFMPVPARQNRNFTYFPRLLLVRSHHQHFHRNLQKP